MEQSNKKELMVKILLLIYMALCFLNLFLPDGISARVYPEQSLYQDVSNKLFVILRWLNDISLVCLPIAIFYNKKAFNQIASFILLPVLIICVISFKKYLQMYSNGYGEGIMNIRFFNESTKAFFINNTFRSIYLIILFLLELVLILYVLIKNRKGLLFNNVTEVKNFLFIFLGLFLVIMPIYAPSYIFNGYALEDAGWLHIFKIGSFWHILWILFLPVETIVLYRIFRKFNDENRYVAMLVLAIGLFYEFNGIYTCFGEIVTQRYPFQLCNLASFLILPTIITRNKILSTFTLTVNAVGAFIAVIMCDSSSCGVTYIMNVHYIVEHSKIIYIPLLCYLLGIYKKIDKSDIKTVIIGFSLYYLFVFITGEIFTGIYNKTGNDYWRCNYLFMFDKEATVNIASFTESLFDIKIVLFDFFTIHLFQALVYVVLLVVSLGYFYLFLSISNHKKKILKQS